jgi:predicted transcriptional regulator
MMPATIQVLDDHDEEFAEILIKQGMTPVVARTLTFLKNTESAKHRDIELGTRMRQQDVSRALRWLRDKGWVSSMDVKQERKRGYNLYSLVEIARTDKEVARMKAFDLDEVN